MAESRWLRLNTDWHLSDWLVVLSAESRLAWVQLLCHMKLNGSRGKCKALSPMVAERLWFVNEPSIRQMLQAAQQAGALVVDEESWEMPNWKKYQGDETHGDRQQRYRDRKAKNESLSSDGCDGEVTVSDGGDASPTLVTPTETVTITETITETDITPLKRREPSPGPFKDVSDVLTGVAVRLGLSPPTDAEVKRHLRESHPTRRMIEKFGVARTIEISCWAIGVKRARNISDVWASNQLFEAEERKSRAGHSTFDKAMAVLNGK